MVRSNRSGRMGRGLFASANAYQTRLVGRPWIVHVQFKLRKLRLSSYVASVETAVIDPIGEYVVDAIETLGE